MLVQAEAMMSIGKLHWLDGEATEIILSIHGEVVPLLDRVVAEMVEQNYPPRTCWEMRLILEEAVVNGLKHGNGGDSSKQVRVRYLVRPEAVLAEVEDDGAGFDPSAVADPTDPENWERPCGRGLLLMRHYATWLRYNGCGNRLSLCKCRPDAHGLAI